MSEDASGLATLTRKAGVVEARLTRRIDHPPANVWRMCCQPALRMKWV